MKEGFNLEIKNTKIFKKIIDTLVDIVDEGTFVINNGMMIFEALDPSRITVLHIRFLNDFFDKYESSEEFKIPLKLTDFIKIIKRATNKDSITLEHLKGDNQIKIKMKNNQNRTKTFRTTMIELDVQNVHLNKLLMMKHNNSFVIDPNLFKEILLDAEIYQDIIHFLCLPDQQMVKIMNNTMYGGLEFNVDKNLIMDYEITESTSSEYAITFLKIIVKMADIIDTFKIFLSSDYPIRIDIGIEGVEVHFFVAPRVDVDSEGFDDDDDMEEF